VSSEHVSAAYLQQIWPNGPKGPHPPLNNAQAALLASKLRIDSAACFYSGLLTIADAVRGLDQGFYSWSVTKLYYSCFYLLRAYLAVDGISMFYLGVKPRWCEAVAGSGPQKAPVPRGQLGSETSHKFVFNLFSAKYPRSILLSQEIDGEHPFFWLQSKRERFNYRYAKFVEPECPDCFRYVEEEEIQNLISLYRDDGTYLYAFDPEHAMLAFPIAVVREVRKKFASHALQPLSGSDRDDMQGYWRDKYGPMRVVRPFL
jgi:hypothetical protein